MARPKSINKYKVEDLLSFLEKSRTELAKETDVYKYIQDLGLQPGKTFYPNSILYYLYVKDKKYKFYNRRAFFRFFSKFFTVKVTHNVRGYLLADTLKMTEEDYINSRILTRNDQYGKKKKSKKENKKIQSKIRTIDS